METDLETQRLILQPWTEQDAAGRTVGTGWQDILNGGVRSGS